MNRLANVLVASRDSRRAGPLMDSLASSRCDALLCDTPAAFLAHARGDQPDVAIIDHASLGAEALDTARALRAAPESGHVPIMLAGADPAPAVIEAALAAGIDDLLAGPVPQDEFMCRLRPLLRLSTMHAEMGARLALARSFGIDVDVRHTGDDDAPFRVLVAASGRLDEARIRNALPPGCEITVSDALDEAETLLGARMFDACVLRVPAEADHAPYRHLEFCNQVRNNPRLFNLPIVVAAPEVPFPELAGPLFKNGASRVLGDDPGEEALRFVLLSLVNRQRARWRLRLILEATRRGRARDDRTDTYAFPFLEAHLGRQIESARAWRKNLAVVCMGFPNVANVRREFGEDAGEHLLQQLAQWITGLIRAEDMVARHGDHEFCVILPDTPLEEANAVMHRVAGVVSYTDFAVREVYQPISVWVEMGIAELSPQDSAASLLKRARGQID